VTLRLDPPELGEVTIRIASREGSMSGEIAVENRHVHDVVQRHLVDLREALTGQGVQVDRLDVSVDGRSAADADREPRQALHDDRPGRGTPEDPQDREQHPSAWDGRPRGRSDLSEGGVDFVA
jgi:flagellar hook-length control protein FliK